MFKTKPIIEKGIFEKRFKHIKEYFRQKRSHIGRDSTNLRKVSLLKFQSIGNR